MVCDEVTVIPKSDLNLPVLSKEEKFMDKLDSSLFMSLGIERNTEPMPDFNLTPLKPLDLSATPELDSEKDILEEKEDTTVKPCNLISPLDNEIETTLSPSTSDSMSDDSQKNVTVEDEDEIRAAQCFLLSKSNSFRIESPLFSNQEPIPHRNHILDLVSSLVSLKDQKVPAPKTLETEEIVDHNVPSESENDNKEKPAKRKRMSLLASMKKKPRVSGTFLAPKTDEKPKEIFEFAKPKELRHCDYCFKKFSDITMFLQHLRIHKNPLLRCAKCGVQKSHIIYKRSHEVKCFKRDAIIRYYCMKNSKNGIVDPFATDDDCELVDRNSEW